MNQKPSVTSGTLLMPGWVMLFIRKCSLERPPIRRRNPLSREHDASRAADADTDARRRQAPVTGDAIADDRPAVLVGDVEEALRRIEGEEARRAAMGRHPLARRERALGRIDGEHADAVVAAVGNVEIAAGAIDRDLGASAVAGEPR